MGCFLADPPEARKLGSTGRRCGFESTTVSLSTAVPRPVERRGEERVSALLRVAKLTGASGEQQLIRVRNLSAGGLMAIVTTRRK